MTSKHDSASRRAGPRPGPFEPLALPLKDVHRLPSSAPPGVVFDCVRRLGGEVGWHGTDGLWQFRGAIDRLMGGVGMRRGRSDPVDLLPGDAIDFWRVQAVEPGSRLLLRAEMKNPGIAWMEILVSPRGEGSELTLTVYFQPTPFWGRLYYASSYPAHWLVFQKMARDIVRAAERAGRRP
ncbi:hypothetical protein OJF2_01260 [Aquisphaera giovannonii]|uniref:DUF2867 domain-containing protein n=1 Tax=Aquisphaera giovannonii TaxID=406548 RepID=A0A5B9VV34_9BACT|nr:DUF2867 domain-containing protein [Aquisphaera giovannonii]QEH31661.1 hypothetical protein OJF2_01260 [Aquisphaera giovannonii]